MVILLFSVGKYDGLGDSLYSGLECFVFSCLDIPRRDMNEQKRCFMQSNCLIFFGISVLFCVGFLLQSTQVKIMETLRKKSKNARFGWRGEKVFEAQPAQKYVLKHVSSRDTLGQPYVTVRFSDSEVGSSHLVLGEPRH